MTKFVELPVETAEYKKCFSESIFQGSEEPTLSLILPIVIFKHTKEYAEKIGYKYTWQVHKSETGIILASGFSSSFELADTLATSTRILFLVQAVLKMKPSAEWLNRTPTA